jgi:uncharacterized caspase-like protein
MVAKTMFRNLGYVSLLDNPVRDARAISKALFALDFTVYLTTDLNQARFRRALGSFKAKIVGADVALVYFAGHGALVGDVNYLLSTDFGADETLDTFQAVSVEEILASMSSELRTNIVFIDAGRNNPLSDPARQGSGP